MSEPAVWSGDAEAIDFLVGQGFEYTGRCDWIRPAPDHRLSPREEAAIDYLKREFEWGEVLR
jgi:hypothetical protein